MWRNKILEKVDEATNVIETIRREKWGTAMPKLLIIDDESDIREFARSYFKKRGMEMFTASDGHEGLDIISAENPDLVLLDMRMDGISGIEVLQEMRAKNFQNKVILITGAEDPDMGDQARALGIVDFVHKPLILSELEKIVMRELGGNVK